MAAPFGLSGTERSHVRSPPVPAGPVHVGPAGELERGPMRHIGLRYANRPRETAISGATTQRNEPLSTEQITPYGYCKCGCGEKTKPSNRTRYAQGLIRGEPRPYLPGHKKNKQGPLNQGERFGRLTVDRYYHRPVSSSWIDVTCDCGTRKQVRLSNLKNNTRSCGCLRDEQTAERGRASARHGHLSGGKASPTYNSFQAMKSRCQNPNDPTYRSYGGRGITVCEEWQSFDGFLDDMGTRPDGMTLDRIDPDGNYEPKNCRWSTPKEQQRNTRRARGMSSADPTVGEILDAAGVPTPTGYRGAACAARVAGLIALLEHHGIDPKGQPDSCEKDLQSPAVL